MLVTNKLLSSLVTKSFDLSEEDVTIYENRISNFIQLIGNS